MLSGFPLCCSSIIALNWSNIVLFSNALFLVIVKIYLMILKSSITFNSCSIRYSLEWIRSYYILANNLTFKINNKAYCKVYNVQKLWFLLLIFINSISSCSNKLLVVLSSLSICCNWYPTTTFNMLL